jgi:hypothetical protein
MMRRLALPVAALALAVVMHAPAPAAAQPGAENDRARQLFKRGRDEYAKDHVPQAYALFLEAWGLQKSFDIAGNLAVVERQIARPRDAAEHAAYALANFPAGGTDAQRKALQDLLVEARATCGAVTIRVSVDRALVTVDGRAVGESPLPVEVFVEPGSHVVVATAPGCDPVQGSVRTDRGTTHLINLTPSRCGPRPPPNKTTTTTVAPTGPGPITLAGIITTGVGVGLGAGFAIMSKVKADAASAQLPFIPGGPTNPTACATPTMSCPALHDALASHDTFASAAVWTFVAAGAVGAGTVIYTVVVPRPQGAVKAARIQAIPLAGPGTGGLMLKGAF